MDILVSILPTISTIVVTIMSLLILGVGIYLVFLLIKGLIIYIKNNFLKR